MPIYAALLRGIMPTNPNMRNEKLRGVFESFDTTHPSTTKFMAEIDKKFNKEVTTQTWKTIEKIVEKMKLDK